jgi:hypothetical protein
MKQLEKNVYDVKVVYWSTIMYDEPWTVFLTKEDAIDWTNKYKKETSEYLTEEEMAEYGIDDDAEEYIETIELDPKKERTATDSNGDLVIEYLNPYSGRWEEKKYC